MAIKDSVLGLGDGFESAMASASALGQAAGGFINKINSIVAGDNRSPNGIRDMLTNGFLATNSVFKPQYFIRAFDEPTYLTFRIEFMMDPNDLADRNVTVNNIGTNEMPVSNTLFSTVYDYMPEPFLDDFCVIGSIDTSIGKRYSTERYLDYSLGDHVRASLLHSFKLALKDIQENFPFYFKSIDGISSLTNVNPESGIRLGKDTKITLTCLEGLDLKITQLLQLYRKIVWDDTYQRWVLPDMMRYFGMRIYVSEIRTFHEYRKKNDPADMLMGDFSNQDSRNATSFPLPKQNLWQTINNAVNTATAVSSAFLGTKNIVSQALEKTANVFTTINDVYGSISNAINTTFAFNNAINTVLPTICYECHMCEFDIASTMEHINQLKSDNMGSSASSPEPKIVIKVGQVKEISEFPLNASLMATYDGKYKASETLTEKDFKKITNFDVLEAMRSNPKQLMFTGNHVSDALLNRRYMNANTKDGNKLGSRIDEMVSNIYSTKGVIDDNGVLAKRMPKKLQDAVGLGQIGYDTQSMTESLSHLSLTAALLNEAVSDIPSLQIKSKSTNPTEQERQSVSSIKERLEYSQQNHTATRPNRTLTSTMKSIREIMMEAAERIYGSKDLNSLALSEHQKAKIADDLYDEFVKKLENTSTATENKMLKTFLNNYKEIKKEQETSKATSKNNKIENFSILN